MKIIEAQIKDRSTGAGEWSRYVVGENGVLQINRISQVAGAYLEIIFDDGRKITFIGCTFFYTEK